MHTPIRHGSIPSAKKIRQYTGGTMAGTMTHWKLQSRQEA